MIVFVFIFKIQSVLIKNIFNIEFKLDEYYVNKLISNDLIHMKLAGTVKEDSAMLKKIETELWLRLRIMNEFNSHFQHILEQNIQSKPVMTTFEFFLAKPINREQIQEITFIKSQLKQKLNITSTDSNQLIHLKKHYSS